MDALPPDWPATRPYVALIACHSAREVASVYGSTSHADINTSCQLPPSNNGARAKETKEVGVGEKRSEGSQATDLLLSVPGSQPNKVLCRASRGCCVTNCCWNCFWVETLASGVKSGVKIATEDQITPSESVFFFFFFRFINVQICRLTHQARFFQVKTTTVVWRVCRPGDWRHLPGVGEPGGDSETSLPGESRWGWREPGCALRQDSRHQSLVFSEWKRLHRLMLFESHCSLFDTCKHTWTVPPTTTTSWVTTWMQTVASYRASCDHWRPLHVPRGFGAR